MKSLKLLMVAVIFAIVLLFFLLIISGCKSDITQPIWDKPYTNPPTPKITSVVPAQAAAGVNTITINGENFTAAPGVNYVYFDNTPSEVLSSTSTSIVVRRPNVVTDSAVIKVVPSKALMAAKYSPYKVDQVIEEYGEFTDNITLNVVVTDNQENLYVVEGKNIHKVTPAGEKSVLVIANRPAFDAKIGPDGNLYLLGNNRAIDKVDLSTGELISKWVQLPSGKNAKYGDFDDNGNFYVGGKKTDLLVVDPNLTVLPAPGYYNTSEILAVRYFNNYVYVAAKNADYADTAKIYRHPIDAGGNIGAQELVLDMKMTEELSSREIMGLTFSSAGLMYLATDAINPIVTFNLADGTIDFLYKEILRPYCKSFCWGTGNFIYMINGDTNIGEEWKVYRVDAGFTGIN
ncbi:MAG: IPT/TIG domain-containing protein [bacterium]